LGKIRREVMSTSDDATPTKKVRAVPEGYHTVAPHLCVDNAAQALEFYRKAFGARELNCLKMPDGKIGHVWIISTHIEDVTPKEAEGRNGAFMKQRAAGPETKAVEK
jgi:hypothetical protein